VDPNDGDDTMLSFAIKVTDGVVTVAEDAIAPFSAVEAWLRRNLANQSVAPTVRRYTRAGG
jgi:hypothetical protein